MTRVMQRRETQRQILAANDRAVAQLRKDEKRHRGRRGSSRSIRRAISQHRLGYQWETAVSYLSQESYHVLSEDWSMFHQAHRSETQRANCLVISLPFPALPSLVP